MKHIGKRGMEAWVLVSLILLILTAVVLIAFMSNFGGFIEVAQGKASCQTWVDVQSSRLGKPALGFKAFNYDSPCKTYVESVKADNEDVLYRSFADKQLNCLSSYRFGREDFFSDLKFERAKTYCRACNEVYVDSESEIKKFDWGNYQIFLNTKKPKYNEKTYAELLTDVKDARIDFGSVDATMIDYGKPFYVMFTVDNDIEWGKRVQTGIIEGVGLDQLFRRGLGGRAIIATAKKLILKIPGKIAGAANVVGLAVTVGSIGTVTLASKGFRPGTAIMTGDEVVRSECDLATFYINPEITDKKLESKLKEYDKNNVKK
ncbi:MAG TPA: hypothetical protein VJJ21_00565 [Candidatus Nanoarchaeia archaeon]|nr:hypothetical protein [Candidatus Nanoarchaeia archaeon]